MGRKKRRSTSEVVQAGPDSPKKPTGSEPVQVEVTAPVRRLHGVAAGAAVDRKSYREHLLRKYGGR